jgi:hypothetical protein
VADVEPTNAITPEPDEAGVPTPGRHFLAPSRRARPVHIDILCHAAELTTATYSFGYVAHWAGGDPGAVKNTAERVITTARTVLQDSGLLEVPSVPAPAPVAA